MEGWYKAKELQQSVSNFSTSLKACWLSQRVSPATVTYDENRLDRHKTLFWLRFAACGSRNFLGACHTGTPWPGNQLFILRSRFRSKNKPVHLPSVCLPTHFKLRSLKVEICPWKRCSVSITWLPFISQESKYYERRGWMTCAWVTDSSPCASVSPHSPPS